MDNIVSSMIESSKIISAPTGEAAMGPVNSENTTQETNTPLVADALELGQFYLPQAGELLAPEQLSGIKDKINAISEYARDSIKQPTEDAVANFINEILSNNEWNKLKPLDKLEKMFSYVDLQRRIAAMKTEKNIIKNLKDSLNA